MSDYFRNRCKAKRPSDTSLCNYHIKLAEYDRFLLKHISRFCLKMLTGIQVSGDFDCLWFLLLRIQGIPGKGDQHMTGVRGLRIDTISWSSLACCERFCSSLNYKLWKELNIYNFLHWLWHVISQRRKTKGSHSYDFYLTVYPNTEAPCSCAQFFSELRQKKIKRLHETFLFTLKHKCLRISEMSGINNCYINKLIFSSVTYTYLLTSLLTYLLTPWIRVFLEKLTGFQLVTKFPAF